MTNKRGVYLYLTSEVIDKLKRQGINISELVDSFLSEYVSFSKEEDIDSNIKNKEAEIEALKQIKEKSKTIKDHPRYKEIINRGKQHPDKLNGILNQFNNVIGCSISLEEFRKMIEEDSDV